MNINIIDLDNFDINQVKYAKSVNNGTTSSKKISIGYDDNIELYILTPYMINKIDYLPNRKYSFFKMHFDPMLGPILKFFKMIQSLEHNVKQHINRYSNKLEINTIIKTDNTDLFDDNDDDNTDLIKMIYLKLSNQQHKIYDNNSEECSLDKLRNEWKYKVLLKIDSIWINSDKRRYGLKIEMVQLKIYQPIYQMKCLIDNENENKELKKNKYLEREDNGGSNVNINQTINIPISNVIIPDNV